MRVLVIKNDGLGDLVLSGGIIEQLAESLGASVDLVTCEENREYAQSLRNVENIFYVSRDGLGNASLGMGRASVAEVDETTLEVLRATVYDIAIVLRRFIRASTFDLMAAVSAREKVCCWQFQTNIPFGTAQAISESNGWRQIDPGEFPLWEPSYYSKFLREAFGITVRPSPALVESARPKGLTSGQGPIGLVLSGSSSRWPDVKWLDLAELLVENGFPLQLIRSKNESRLAAELVTKHSANITDCGIQSLQEIRSTLAKLRAVVGNDTGLVHLSQIVGTPAVVVSGGGHFRRFFPYDDSSLRQIVVTRPMNCFDCAWSCWQEEKRCLSEIPANSVLEALIELEKGGPPRYHFTKPGRHPYTVAGMYSQSFPKTGGWLTETA